MITFGKVKLERVAEMPTPLFNMDPEDDMFCDFTMSLKTWSLNVESYQMNSMTTI